MSQHNYDSLAKVRPRVLTIAATFPSLIQPWLVNQLVQIIKNGGTNFILARRSELGVYTQDIDRYGLVHCFKVVPEARVDLLRSVLSNFSSLGRMIALVKGLIKFPVIFLSNEFTLKEKFFTFFLLPYLGLNDIDIIHSHSEMAGHKFFPIIRALKRPLVVTFHGLPPVGVEPITAAQRQQYSGEATVILVNTEFAKKQYVSLGAPADKIRILPQGIVLDDFPFRLRPFPGGAVNILTVGRYHPDKGQRYALAAVAELIQNGVEIKYRLVGNGPDKRELEDLSKQLGIAAHVEFYSGLTNDELHQVYAQSHIFVLPSLKSRDGFHEETQGVVLQEAQASGLIVIATKTGGIPECIDDGVSGFLVEDRSSEALAQKLSEVIAEPSAWEAYQRAGRLWVEQRYDIDIIGKEINSIYRELVDRGN